VTRGTGLDVRYSIGDGSCYCCLLTLSTAVECLFDRLFDQDLIWREIVERLARKRKKAVICDKTFIQGQVQGPGRFPSEGLGKGRTGNPYRACRSKRLEHIHHYVTK